MSFRPSEEEQEDRKRYPFSYVSRLLHAGARTPLLLFDAELTARKNALFQAASIINASSSSLWQAINALTITKSGWT
jgi:hypothetical protein